jgi:hypothetical protein
MQYIRDEEENYEERRSKLVHFFCFYVNVALFLSAFVLLIVLENPSSL